MLACFAAGGLLYTFVVGALLGRFRPSTLIRAGGLLSASGLLALGLSPLLWTMPVTITVLGFGFYLIHNPLQVHATQILPSARGTGVALFATCLFLAQSLGVALGAPMVDAWGFWPVCVISAIIMAAAGQWLARRLIVAPVRGG